MKIIASKKGREHDIILNYKGLDKKESLKKAQQYIKEKTKLIDGWKFKIK